jgi:hypothetical protein
MTKTSIPQGVIRFPKAKTLSETLEKIYVPPIKQTTQDANSCCLIHQMSFSTTWLTTIDPGRAVLKRLIRHAEDYSGGSEGAEYLVQAPEFLEKLKRIDGDDSLVLKPNVNGLALNAMQLVDGKDRRKHTLVAKVYNGPVSDFGPIPIPSNPIAVIDASQFEVLIKSLNTLGEFGTEKRHGADVVNSTVLIDFKKGRITAVAHNVKRFNQAHVKVSVPGLVVEEHKVGIEGVHLKYFQGLSYEAAVTVYYDETEDNKWLSFTGDLGTISVRVVETSLEHVVQSQVFGLESPKIQQVATRVCSYKSLEEAAKIQKPTGSSQNLLVLEATPFLQIQDAQDLTGVQSSVVHIYPTQVEGEWEPILCNVNLILLLTLSLAAFQSAAKVDSVAALLRVKRLTKASGRTMYLLDMEPAGLESEAEGKLESAVIQLFGPVNLATDHIDELDTMQ